MYSGLCLDCRHAFNHGPGLRWTDEKPHHCARVVASYGMTRGKVSQCSDYDSKRFSAKGFDHEYTAEA